MKNILILDDCLENHDYYSHILSEYLHDKYYLVQCFDGSEARKKFEENPISYDLFITDIMHVGESTFELIKYLRAAHSHTKIMICSAAGGYYSDDELSLSDVYLVKPVNAKSTFIKIVKLLLGFKTH